MSSVDARNWCRWSELKLEKLVRRVSSSNMALNHGCNPVLASAKETFCFSLPKTCIQRVRRSSIVSNPGMA